MHQYINLYTVIETICFSVSVFCLRKDPHIIWRILIAYLFITCVVEIGTIPMKEIYNKNPSPKNSNAWVFNILLLFQISFNSMMFLYLINKHRKGRPLILSGLFLLFVLYAYEMIFFNKNCVFDYNFITYTVMSIIFVLYSLYYYYLILKSELYIELKSSASFWWVTGSLFFYFGTTAINIYSVVLKKIPASQTLYMSYINNTLIITLYGCWIVSFICKKWTTQRSDN